jgi:hypothetical protein
METKMFNRLKFGLLIALIVAVAVLAAFWATLSLQQSSLLAPRQFPRGGFIPGDFEIFYVVFTIISTINIALLVMLLVTYISIYAKTRSPFTIGLVIFALVFLIKDIASSPFVVGLFSFRAVGLGPFEFLPGILEFAALSVLIYLSIKY